MTKIITVDRGGRTGGGRKNWGGEGKKSFTCAVKCVLFSSFEWERIKVLGVAYAAGCFFSPFSTPQNPYSRHSGCLGTYTHPLMVTDSVCSLSYPREDFPIPRPTLFSSIV